MESFTWNYLDHPVHSVRQRPPQQLSDRDQPAVLLVHGFGASTDHWRHNIPALADRYEVHALDLLGFGRSAKPQGLPYGGCLWRRLWYICRPRR